METLNENKTMVEIENNKFLEMDSDQAIEFAVRQYFENNRIIRLNNKKFDIFDFGNWQEKLVIDNE